MTGVFVSHSTTDRAGAHDLAERLSAKGYTCFLDFDSIPGGAEWEQSIYTALGQSLVVLLYATPEAIASCWVFAEVMIARFRGIPVIPILVRDCQLWRHVESTTQYIDLRSDPAAGYGRLWKSLANLQVTFQARRWPHDRAPYPGLAAFEEEDAPVFFGREHDLAAAIALLRPGGQQQRFLTLVGPSGSGKSSFVRAGLLPVLKRGAIPGSERWIYLPSLAPAAGTPLRHLAEGLRAIAWRLGDVAEIEERLHSPDTLLSMLLTARADLGRPGVQIVLVVDQLEDLQQRGPTTAAERMLAALANVLQAPATPLIVLATLRADFLSECLQVPALAPFLTSGTMLLGAMDRAALREVVVGPAGVAGLEFDDGLVETLLDDTEGGDALPLMADVLRQLWLRSADRRPRRVSHHDYRQLGGVKGCLAQRAQACFDALGEESRSALRSALVRLADVNDRGDLTRRRVRRDRLPSSAREAIDRLVDERLLVASADSQTGESAPCVEVAHEALLRNWPLLRGWLDSESDRLRLRRQIEIDATEWDRHERVAEYVWRAGRLAAAQDLMLAEHWLESDVRRQFVEAGHAHHVASLERESLLLANRILKERQEDPERAILVALAAIEEYAWTPRAEQALNAAIDGSALRLVLWHRGHVTNAAVSGDGTRIITASADQTAQVWDACSGEPLLTLRGHEGWVTSAGFSPDGTRIVTASRDRTARLWDADSGEALFTLRGHDGWLSGAAFSRDGSRVVTASRDRTARLWSADTGRALPTVLKHRDLVWSAAFSPDDSRVVTGCDDNVARVWDAESGRLLVTLEGHTDSVLHAAFSPDGAWVVTGSAEGVVRLWDIESGEALSVVREHEDAVSSLAFSHDGSEMLTGSRDGTVRRWGFRTRSPLATPLRHPGPVLSAALDPDGSRIVTACEDGATRVWACRPANALLTLSGHEGSVWSVSYSPDGSRIVTASHDNTARVWDAKSGQARLNLLGSQGWVRSAAFSPDGSRIVTGSRDATGRVWDAESGEALLVLRGHEDAVWSTVFSCDGTCIVTSSSDATARVWDAASARALLVLRGHDGPIRCAAFSPDGKLVVTASYDGTARVWDARSGEPVLTLRGERSLWSAEFSPDGGRIATGSEDRTAAIWDVLTGREILRLSDHGGWVRRATFSPDGRRILTASEDGSAHLWDADSGQPLHVLRAHTGALVAATFGPDGRTFATACTDTVQVWASLTRDALVALARSRAFRELTPEERREYGLTTGDRRSAGNA